MVLWQCDAKLVLASHFFLNLVWKHIVLPCQHFSVSLNPCHGSGLPFGLTQLLQEGQTVCIEGFYWSFRWWDWGKKEQIFLPKAVLKPLLQEISKLTFLWLASSFLLCFPLLRFIEFRFMKFTFQDFPLLPRSYLYFFDIPFYSLN